MLNDDIMRLVEVRDLLNGQGWADPMQYRLGPDGGTLMHWSRLVDAPVAALIWLASPALPLEQAEMVAVVLWPLALAGMGLAFVMRAAREMSGDIAGIFALVIGAGGFIASQKFDAGSLDHHNVQIVLVLVALVALLREKPTIKSGASAGIAVAVSLAIGFETIVYIAIMAGYVALKWALSGARDEALGFSAGIALAMAGLAALLQPDLSLTVFKCDSFGPELVRIGLFAGAGFLLLVYLGGGFSRVWRLLATGGFGAAVIGFAYVFSPACLRNPYSGLYPEVASEWLARIGEVKGLFAYIAFNDGASAGAAAVPVIAALMALKLALDKKYRARALLLVALLGISYALAVYQVRGIYFLLIIAAVPMASIFGVLNNFFPDKKNSALGVAVFALFILSIPAIPTKMYKRFLVTPSDSYARRYEHEVTKPVGDCYSAKNLAPLASLPQGYVTGHSNIGAYVLEATPHRVMSANFHRNQDGLRNEIELARAPLPEAEKLLRQWGVDYVIFCDNFTGSLVLSENNEGGLWPRLYRGEAVGFLEPVERALDNAVHVLRVKPEGDG